MILGVLGYEISFVAAAFALLVGVVANRVLLNAVAHGLGGPFGAPVVPVLPTIVSLWGIPILLLSSWIVQQAAHREQHAA
jgi:hypothetical protein